jgi:hypothetical protein
LIPDVIKAAHQEGKWFECVVKLAGNRVQRNPGGVDWDVFSMITFHTIGKQIIGSEGRCDDDVQRLRCSLSSEVFRFSQERNSVISEIAS